MMDIIQKKVDALDEQILIEYQKDASVTYQALSEKMGLPTSTVFNRIKKMQDSGIIQNIIPLVDPLALGFKTTAWIKLSIDMKEDCCKVAEKIAKNRKLLEVHEVAGDWDILAKVKVYDNLDLHDLAKELIQISEVSRISTLIALKTIKEEHILPIEEYYLSKPGAK